MSVGRCITAAVVCCLTLHTVAFAQVTTADIVGRVTDASGAVLPGVTVTVENLGTHETRVATGPLTGDYAFTLLPISRSPWKVELQGFTSRPRGEPGGGDHAITMPCRLVRSPGRDRHAGRRWCDHYRRSLAGGGKAVGFGGNGRNRAVVRLGGRQRVPTRSPAARVPTIAARRRPSPSTAR
jgi:hypothetical protein